VRHVGRGRIEDVLRVYAMSGERRVGHAATFDTGDGTATLRLRSFVVKKCEEETLRIVGDFSSDAELSGEHSVEIDPDASFETSVDDVTVMAAASRKLRIAGQSEGAIQVEYLRLVNRVSYGKERVVARLKLSADGEADHAIHSITLTNEGSARDGDLRNIRLQTNDRKHASEKQPMLDGDSVTLSFEKPLVLEKNEKVTLRVVADVLASRRRTIQLLVEEPSDIDSRPIRSRRR